jgi:pyridoxamine 5'-phosphate oxidase
VDGIGGAGSGVLAVGISRGHTPRVTCLPAAAPDDPVDLFLEWLNDAIRNDVPAPHAMTLSTVDARGHAVARVLILKDLNDAGWHFAARSDSPKGQQIAANAQVALTFFWHRRGRQIRIQGRAASTGESASAADFLARPEGSRASGLVGRQSLPMASAEEHRAALALARERIAADPGMVAKPWTVYAVRAETVEFWQASHDRSHVRLRYEEDATAWRKVRLWP